MRVTFPRLPDRERSYALVERDDGAVYRLYGGPASPRLPHDIMHFVVERELAIPDGIWGGIASGIVFSSMRHVSGRRPSHSAERSRQLLAASVTTACGPRCWPTSSSASPRLTTRRTARSGAWPRPGCACSPTRTSTRPRFAGGRDRPAGRGGPLGPAPGRPGAQLRLAPRAALAPRRSRAGGNHAPFGPLGLRRGARGSRDDGGCTRPARLPDEVIDHGEVRLRRHGDDDLDAVYQAVTESLDHLRPWMPWAADYTRQAAWGVPHRVGAALGGGL